MSHLWQHLTCLGAGLGAEGCSAGAHLRLRSSDQIWQACRCCTPVLSELCFVHASNQQATMAVHGSRCFHELSMSMNACCSALWSRPACII